MKYKPKKFLFILVVLVISLSIPGIVYGSYVYWNMLKDYHVTAESEFYFTSDYLAEGQDTPVYPITHNWTTNASVHFELRNYKSILQIANQSIPYTVQTSLDGVGCQGTLYPVNSVGQKSEIDLSIPVPANVNVPLELAVTASAISPYTKTLHAKFIISPAISYHTTSNIDQPVAICNFVIAHSSQSTRTVLITWQEGAAPDMTSPIIIHSDAIDLENRTITATLNTAASYDLVFYKNSWEADYVGVSVTGI